MADSESSSTKKNHHHHHHNPNGSRHHERDSHDYKPRKHDSKSRSSDERIRSERSVRDSDMEKGDQDGRSVKAGKDNRSERGDRDVRNGRSDADNRSEKTDKESEHRSHKSRDKERGHDRERDHERRHRHKSRSQSRGRSRHHSRSRSRSSDRRSSKRQSGFDMAPPTAAGGGVTLPGQLANGPPAAVPAMPGLFTFAAAQFSTMPTMSMQSMTQQATRHARRVYVGGLPPLANEQTIATFFSQVMTAIGGNTAGPGDAVVNVYINHEKKFAFVEMRTVEEASNAMALDGIIFEGVSVRVRRPTDYNPSVAATLGPSQPSPHLNLGAVGLTPGAIGGADGPDRVFVGGLPYYLTEVQIKELLESFGPLRGFDLVKDQDTGNSKGYGFCVYQDPAVTDVACAALNGLKMGDKTLTVRRATASGQPKPDQVGALAQAQQQFAIQVGSNAAASLAGFPSLMTALPASIISGMMSGMTNGTMTLESPTKVVCLSQVVTLDELKEDEVYEEIYDDMKDECSKYGTLLNLVIPRPGENEDSGTGVGKVFLQYNDEKEATKAKDALHGRKFGGNTVSAVFYPEDKFSQGEYN